jgi:hypothetical protein
MNVQRSSDPPSRGRRLAAPTSIKRGALGTENTVCHPPSEDKRRTFQRQRLCDHRAPEFGRTLPTPLQRSPAVFHVSGIFTAACPDESSLQPASDHAPRVHHRRLLHRSRRGRSVQTSVRAYRTFSVQQRVIRTHTS